MIPTTTAAEAPGALDADERAEPKRWGEENKDLRMDCEIPYQAAVPFGRDAGGG